MNLTPYICLIITYMVWRVVPNKRSAFDSPDTEFTLIGVRQAQSHSLAFPALTFSLWEKDFQVFQKFADNPLKTWKTSQWVMFGGMLISTDN